MKNLHGFSIAKGIFSAINLHHYIDFKAIRASFCLATRLLSIRFGLHLPLNGPLKLAS